MADQKKVLLIDDDNSVRQALGNKINELKNVTLLQADNGEDGLKMAFDEKPDLIFLDIVMPKMHGIDTLNNLQSDEWGKKVPVVLLTNYADDPRVGEAVKLGRCELLDKTQCKLEDITSKIEEKLSL